MARPTRRRGAAAAPTCVSLAGLLVSVAWASLANAKPTENPVALTWEAPPGCPVREEVSAAIDTRLAGSERASFVHIEARARVRRRAGEWTVELTTDDGVTKGKRTIHAESCPIAADAVVLILALAVDPQAISRASNETGARGAPQEAPTSTKDETDQRESIAPSSAPTARAAPATIRPDPTPKAPTRSEWILGVRGLAGFGQLPSLSTGMGAFVGWQRDRLRIELDAVTWLPRSITFEGDASTGGAFRLQTIGLRGCYGPRSHGWSVAGCLGAQVEALSGRGFGTPRTSEGTEHQLSPSAGILVAWNVGGPWVLRFDLEATARVLARRAFVLDERDLYRASWLAADASLGLELHF